MLCFVERRPYRDPEGDLRWEDGVSTASREGCPEDFTLLAQMQTDGRPASPTSHSNAWQHCQLTHKHIGHVSQRDGMGYEPRWAERLPRRVKHG